MIDKWFVIVNPLAGGGKGKSEWIGIKNLLQKKQVEYDYSFTRYKCHAIELTIEAVEAGYRNILAVGGDGTLNEVVNGVLLQSKVNPVEVSVAMTAVGTGNDWQRTYGKIFSPEESISALANPRYLLQDVGMVEYYDNTGVQTRYFVNAAGVGFDAEVTLNTNKQKEKGRSGRVLYMLNILRTLIKYKASNISITIDNKEVGGQVFSLAIGIGKYNGGGMMQLPNAVPDDGLFDITIFREISVWDVLRNVHRLYNGTILEHGKISGYRADNVSVNSSVDTKLEVDGESLGFPPLRFTILKQAVKMVVGSTNR